jgi:hypothetical protein
MTPLSGSSVYHLSLAYGMINFLITCVWEPSAGWWVDGAGAMVSRLRKAIYDPISLSLSLSLSLFRSIYLAVYLPTYLYIFHICIYLPTYLPIY